MLEDYIKLVSRKYRGRYWSVEDELRKMCMRRDEEVRAYYHK
jgi:hypothetical protein